MRADWSAVSLSPPPDGAALIEHVLMELDRPPQRGNRRRDRDESTIPGTPGLAPVTDESEGPNQPAEFGQGRMAGE